MRKSKFSEEQIAMALRQGEVGTPAAEICRKLGISQGRSTAGRRSTEDSVCRSSGSYDSSVTRTGDSSSGWPI